MNTITLEQLEGMIDLELNILAARLMYKYKEEILVTNSPSDDGHVWVECDNKLTNTNYNPCKNWEDCGDLIDELNLSVVYLGNEKYEATNGYMHHSGTFVEDDFYCTDKNPKRAATIVYILIKQEENK